jgi:hypothetical protein
MNKEGETEMNYEEQIAWQRKVIREEWVDGADDDVHKNQIQRIRNGKRIYYLGGDKRRTAAKAEGSKN